MAYLPGARLGPYEVLERIGAGGMGEVYRARHVKLDRDVAIKVLPAELSADHDRVTRLEREARVASALNHPNIVTIYDIGDHEGTAYIAMELIEGRTLAEAVGEERPSIDAALRIAVQLADALAKAHEAGIVHRDIKPANIMFTGDGLPKILDFGIARPAAGAPLTGQGGAPLTGATVEGAIVGTPHYMSPEQLSGAPVDHRSDQFAFGALLYELVSGQPAFRGSTLAALISEILGTQPRPLRQVRTDTPADLERVVARCLEKDREDRFMSTAQLCEELRRCEERRARAKYGLGALLRRPAVVGTLGGVLILAGVGGGLWVRGADRRWAEREALDEIAGHIERGDVYEAFRVARVAERFRPADPELERVMDRITIPLAVNTDPPGAEVRVKGYATPDVPWELLGVTPLTIRNPYAMMRWRITLDGHEPFEGAPFSGPSLIGLIQGLQLDPVGTVPTGTVRIPGGPSGAPPLIQRPGHKCRSSSPSFSSGTK